MVLPPDPRRGEGRMVYVLEMLVLPPDPRRGEGRIVSGLEMLRLGWRARKSGSLLMDDRSHHPLASRVRARVSCR